ncbi:MAG TPA: GNAT family N-acetyltransferase [Hyphomicrobiaceae bacterium]|nr:GNAT family N-acetyltransferase [Hyphomicrobiaceae bacterium]
MPSIGDVEQSAWASLFGAASEGFDYYLACEKSPPPVFELKAMGVFDEDRLVAGAPAFGAQFRLDMMLEGRLRRLTDWVGARAPRLGRLRVLGLGSPHADELALVFDAALDEADRRMALDCLLDSLERHAASASIDVAFLKNVRDVDRLWADEVLRRRGYVGVATLPIATLAIPSSEASYIASLSANMRSNLRRKLKRATGVRAEARTSIEGLEDEIFRLRESTRRRATTDYDAFSQISPAYFREVLARLGDKARLLLYWRGESLIGFAFVLLEPGRLIEKYNGMRYPEGPDNGIFFLNWMTQVRLCIELGIPELHAGETTYLTKARLGCKLHRSWIYYRHRHQVVTRLLALLSSRVAFDSADPDLRKLGAQAPYVDTLARQH